MVCMTSLLVIEIDSLHRHAGRDRDDSMVRGGQAGLALPMNARPMAGFLDCSAGPRREALQPC
jgi:hypothetical protein